MNQGFLKVAAASPRLLVADCSRNEEQLVCAAQEAAGRGVKVLVFPELSLTGYTCSDLFYSETLLAAAKNALLAYLEETSDLDLLSVVGLPLAVRDKLYNCAAVCKGGQVLGFVPKTNIPNYGEFYEVRQFTPAPEKSEYIVFEGMSIPFGTSLLFTCDSMPTFRFGVEICEDLWVTVPPSCRLAEAGATVIANLSASNETIGKDAYRRLLVTSQSARTVSGYIYADCGDGESTNDIVFSGHSLIAENGTVLAERKPFDSTVGDMIVSEIDVERLSFDRRRMNTYRAEKPESIWEITFDTAVEQTTLTRFVDPHPFVPADTEERSRRSETILSIQAGGLKQRIIRSFAKKCVIGISGGLDSTLALLVAVRAMDALGRPSTDVIGVTMPCFGTTERTKSNAEALCRELGVELREVNIREAVLRHFSDIGHDPENHNVVYENCQARERTQVLMDIANAEGGIVVGTGDLSEMALGWSTYNGDHMSMYAVNCSVPKTLVRHIVGYCADRAESAGETRLCAVLRDVLDTPVSPELLPADGNGQIAQKTEDLVGPYELHDFYLYYMIRFGFAPEKLFRLARYALGDRYDDETLLHWLEVFVRRFFAQQFKRTCVPDGPKVGSIALSPRGDWRMPSDASVGEWMTRIALLRESLAKK